MGFEFGVALDPLRLPPTTSALQQQKQTNGKKKKKKGKDNRSSFELEELHVKDEGGVGRDDPWVPCGAVCHVWGTGDLRSLTQAHLRNSFLPAFDNLLSADLELEGLVSVS